jgi:uncharacterized protein YukE
MPYIGADVDELRVAAVRLDQLATTLESSARTVNSMIGGPWWGADADGFRSQWTNESKPNMTAASAMLRHGADMLRRNAAEQQQVSSTVGGTTVNAASAGQTQPAPEGTAALFNTIKDTDGSYDGLMIQQVMGTDGKIRFIAYLNGTDAADRLTPERNIPVALGGTDTYVEGRIDAALKAAGYQPGPDGTFKNGPEVMLVGYSQGGMDAQNVAAGGRYHVTDLVTYGSPLTFADNPQINTIHLRADGDGVPDLPAEALAVAGGDPGLAAAIRSGLVDGPGDKVPLDQPRTGPSSNIHHYDPRTSAPLIQNGHVNWVNGLVGNHGIADTYLNVGTDFDTSSDPSLADEHRSLARFHGDVVQTWRAATQAPPAGGGGGSGW